MNVGRPVRAISRIQTNYGEEFVFRFDGAEGLTQLSNETGREKLILFDIQIQPKCSYNGARTF